MSLEDRVKLLETSVNALKDELLSLKQMIFQKVVTIEQQHALFSQFDARIQTLENAVQQLLQLIR